MKASRDLRGDQGSQRKGGPRCGGRNRLKGQHKDGSKASNDNVPANDNQEGSAQASTEEQVDTEITTAIPRQPASVPASPATEQAVAPGTQEFNDDRATQTSARPTGGTRIRAQSSPPIFPQSQLLSTMPSQSPSPTDFADATNGQKLHRQPVSPVIREPRMFYPYRDPDVIICLNVNGQQFWTLRATLDPSPVLASIVAGGTGIVVNHPADDRLAMSYFVDSASSDFGIILKHLQSHCKYFPIFFDPIKGHDIERYHALLADADIFRLEELQFYLRDQGWRTRAWVHVDVEMFNYDEGYGWLPSGKGGFGSNPTTIGTVVDANVTMTGKAYNRPGFSTLPAGFQFGHLPANRASSWTGEKHSVSSRRAMYMTPPPPEALNEDGSNHGRVANEKSTDQPSAELNRAEVADV